MYKQQDRLQEELWSRNRDRVLKAVKNLETQEPYSTVRPKQIEKIVNLHAIKKKNLIGQKSCFTFGTEIICLTSRTIRKHLRKLVKEGIIARVGRGEYSSRRALIAKKLAQSFLISDVYDVVPRLEVQSFDNFMTNQFPTFNELEKEYRKKKGNPLQRLQYGRKLKRLLEQKNLAAPYILKGPREDLEFIEKATDMHILASKNLPLLNTYDMKEIVVKVLYDMLSHERAVAEAKEQVFSLKDFGLSIIVIFDPNQKNAGRPPQRETFKENISKYARDSAYFDKERIGRLEKLDQEMRALELDLEKDERPGKEEN